MYIYIYIYIYIHVVNIKRQLNVFETHLPVFRGQN